MSSAHFRFYAELNHFLPSGRRQVEFSYTFQGRPAIKDAIEALGVPHTEVELILINGEPASFARPLADGDRVSVYPVFESLDISQLARLRPRPLRRTRFVLDTHLGKLATYLRLLGFDTLYRNDYSDEALAQIASQERRILLTRDLGLLKRRLVTHGYFVRETNPARQVAEVLRRFDLCAAVVPFARCLRCNGRLRPASREEVAERLAGEISRYPEEFRQCESCGHVYWQGSHYRRMVGFIEQVMALSQCPPLGEPGAK
jgi:uncharacterized protein with PIN domain